MEVGQAIGSEHRFPGVQVEVIATKGIVVVDKETQRRPVAQIFNSIFIVADKQSFLMVNGQFHVHVERLETKGLVSDTPHTYGGRLIDMSRGAWKATMIQGHTGWLSYIGSRRRQPSRPSYSWGDGWRCYRAACGPGREMAMSGSRMSRLRCTPVLALGVEMELAVGALAAVCITLTNVPLGED
ncbi:hypothetical protein DM02DRAFT_633477 [Periconia macrospinosa]|uniref:Uncharacterized protein n=1 Tax=Periconia macrospinosa TaxID=97972 RepID=A0A2V1DC96_9PLEO|nr:hypothetical protein DM02DRAFT_633477 [Periconia macrospinosa]